MAPKVGDVIGRLEAEGWRLTRTRGNHRIFKHPAKPGTVIVAGKPSKDLKEDTWNEIQKQAGWK